MSAPGYVTPVDLQELRAETGWAIQRAQRAHDPAARADFQRQADRLSRILAAVERDMAHQAAVRQQLREGVA